MSQLTKLKVGSTFRPFVPSGLKPSSEPTTSTTSPQPTQPTQPAEFKPPQPLCKPSQSRPQQQNQQQDEQQPRQLQQPQHAIPPLSQKQPLPPSIIDAAPFVQPQPPSTAPNLPVYHEDNIIRYSREELNHIRFEDECNEIPDFIPLYLLTHTAEFKQAWAVAESIQQQQQWQTPKKHGNKASQGNHSHNAGGGGGPKSARKGGGKNDQFSASEIERMRRQRYSMLSKQLNLKDRSHHTVHLQVDLKNGLRGGGVNKGDLLSNRPENANKWVPMVNLVNSSTGHAINPAGLNDRSGKNSRFGGHKRTNIDAAFPVQQIDSSEETLLNVMNLLNKLTNSNYGNLAKRIRTELAKITTLPLMQAVARIFFEATIINNTQALLYCRLLSYLVTPCAVLAQTRKDFLTRNISTLTPQQTAVHTQFLRDLKGLPDLPRFASNQQLVDSKQQDGSKATTIITLVLRCAFLQLAGELAAPTSSTLTKLNNEDDQNQQLTQRISAPSNASNPSDNDPTLTPEQQKMVKYALRKKRAEGTINLLAELYRRNLIPSSIILLCIHLLLGTVNNGANSNSGASIGSTSGALAPTFNDADIDMCCSLLSKAGKMLDFLSNEFLFQDRTHRQRHQEHKQKRATKQTPQLPPLQHPPTRALKAEGNVVDTVLLSDPILQQYSPQLKPVKPPSDLPSLDSIGLTSHITNYQQQPPPLQCLPPLNASDTLPNQFHPLSHSIQPTPTSSISSSSLSPTSPAHPQQLNLSLQSQYSSLHSTPQYSPPYSPSYSPTTTPGGITTPGGHIPLSFSPHPPLQPLQYSPTNHHNQLQLQPLQYSPALSSSGSPQFMFQVQLNDLEPSFSPTLVSVPIPTGTMNLTDISHRNPSQQPHQQLQSLSTLSSLNNQPKPLSSLQSISSLLTPSATHQLTQPPFNNSNLAPQPPTPTLNNQHNNLTSITDLLAPPQQPQFIHFTPAAQAPGAGAGAGPALAPASAPAPGQQPLFDLQTGGFSLLPSYSPLLRASNMRAAMTESMLPTLPPLDASAISPLLPPQSTFTTSMSNNSTTNTEALSYTQFESDSANPNPTNTPAHSIVSPPRGIFLMSPLLQPMNSNLSLPTANLSVYSGNETAVNMPPLTDLNMCELNLNNNTNTTTNERDNDNTNSASPQQTTALSLLNFPNLQTSQSHQPQPPQPQFAPSLQSAQLNQTTTNQNELDFVQSSTIQPRTPIDFKNSIDLIYSTLQSLYDSTTTLYKRQQDEQNPNRSTNYHHSSPLRIIAGIPVGALPKRIYYKIDDLLTLRYSNWNNEPIAEQVQRAKVMNSTPASSSSNGNPPGGTSSNNNMVTPVKQGKGGKREENQNNSSKTAQNTGNMPTPSKTVPTNTTAVQTPVIRGAITVAAVVVPAENTNVQSPQIPSNFPTESEMGDFIQQPVLSLPITNATSSLPPQIDDEVDETLFATDQCTFFQTILGTHTKVHQMSSEITARLPQLLVVDEILSHFAELFIQCPFLPIIHSTQNFPHRCTGKPQDRDDVHDLDELERELGLSLKNSQNGSPVRKSQCYYQTFARLFFPSIAKPAAVPASTIGDAVKAKPITIRLDPTTTPPQALKLISAWWKSQFVEFLVNLSQWLLANHSTNETKRISSKHLLFKIFDLFTTQGTISLMEKVINDDILPNSSFSVDFDAIVMHPTVLQSFTLNAEDILSYFQRISVMYSSLKGDSPRCINIIAGVLVDSFKANLFVSLPGSQHPGSSEVNPEQTNGGNAELLQQYVESFAQTFKTTLLGTDVDNCDMDGTQIEDNYINTIIKQQEYYQSTFNTALKKVAQYLPVLPNSTPPRLTPATGGSLYQCFAQLIAPCAFVANDANSVTSTTTSSSSPSPSSPSSSSSSSSPVVATIIDPEIKSTKLIPGYHLSFVPTVEQRERDHTEVAVSRLTITDSYYILSAFFSISAFVTDLVAFVAPPSADDF